MSWNWDLVATHAPDEERMKKKQKYATYQINLGNGLYKEIRFTLNNSTNLVIEYIKTLPKPVAIQIADNVMLKRMEFLMKIYKGYERNRGKTDHLFAYALLNEYLSNEVLINAFEYNNFSGKFKWSEPKKLENPPKETEAYQEVETSLEQSVKETKTPGCDWLFSYKYDHMQFPNLMESSFKCRQQRYLLGDEVPMPEEWAYPQHLQRQIDAAGEKWPIEEHTPSTKRLLCCFLGMVSHDIYREIRLRYTTEMLNFDVPDMLALIEEVRLMIRMTQAKSYFRMFWAIVQTGVNLSTVKYLYAMFKEGKAAVDEFEFENVCDNSTNWAEEKPLHYFLRYFNRTIHYETNKSGLKVKKQDQRAAQSGLDFMRKFGESNDMHSAFNDVVFNSTPLTEADLYPTQSQNGNHVEETEQNDVEAELDVVAPTQEEQAKTTVADTAKDAITAAFPALPTTEAYSQNGHATNGHHVVEQPAVADESKPTLSYAKIVKKSPKKDSEGQKQAEHTVAPVEAALPVETAAPVQPAVQVDDAVFKVPDLPRVNQAKQRNQRGPPRKTSNESQGTSEQVAPQRKDSQGNTKKNDKKNTNGSGNQNGVKESQKPGQKPSQNSNGAAALPMGNPATNGSTNAESAVQPAPSNKKAQKSSNANAKNKPTEAKAPVKTQNTGTVAPVVNENTQTAKKEEPKKPVAEKKKNGAKNTKQEQPKKSPEPAVSTVEDQQEDVSPPVEVGVTEQEGNGVIQSPNVLTTAEGTVSNEETAPLATAGRGTDPTVEDDVVNAEAASAAPMSKRAQKKAKKAALKEKKEKKEAASFDDASTEMIQKLIMSSENNTHVEADFDIQVDDSKSKAKKNKKRNKNKKNKETTLVEATFTDEMATVVINNAILAARDMFKQPALPTSSKTEKRSKIGKTEEGDSEPYVPGTVVTYDYRPGARSHDGESDSEESNTSHAPEQEGQEMVVMNSKGCSAGNDSDDDARVPSDPEGEASVPLAAADQSHVEQRAANKEHHKMFRQLIFFMEAKSRGGYRNLSVEKKALVKRRLDRFDHIYMFRLRIAKAMNHILDVDLAADVTGEREKKVIQTLMGYVTERVEQDAEKDSTRAREIDEMTKDISFKNARESDMIYRGLRYLDLRIAELQPGCPLHKAYSKVCDRLCFVVQKIETVVNIVGALANYDGYEDYR